MKNPKFDPIARAKAEIAEERAKTERDSHLLEGYAAGLNIDSSTEDYKIPAAIEKILKERLALYWRIGRLIEDWAAAKKGAK